MPTHTRRRSWWITLGGILAVLLGGTIGGLAVSRADVSPVLRTITIGHASYWTLALAEQAHRAFVFNRQDGTVSVLATRTGALLRTVTLTSGNAWVAVATRAGRVFVSNYDVGTITVLDARSGAVLRTLADGGDLGLAVDERAGHVFVGDAGGLVMLDARTGRLLRRLPVCSDAFAVAVSSRTGHIFAKCGDGTIVMLDVRTGRLLRSVPARSGLYGAIVVDERTERVFSLGNQPAMDVIDARTGAYVRAIPIDPSSIAPVIDDRTGRAYLGLGDANTVTPGRHKSEVAVLDGRTGMILHRFPVATNPSALAIDPRTGYVLVSSIGPLDSASDLPTGAGTLSVLDVLHGQVLRTVRVGLGPSDVAIDAPGQRVLVVNAGSDSHGKGTLKQWRPSEGWWPQALRMLKKKLGWLPITAPKRPTATTNGTVTTLDLTRL